MRFNFSRKYIFSMVLVNFIYISIFAAILLIVESQITYRVIFEPSSAILRKDLREPLYTVPEMESDIGSTGFIDSNILQKCKKAIGGSEQDIYSATSLRLYSKDTFQVELKVKGSSNFDGFECINSIQDRLFLYDSSRLEQLLNIQNQRAVTLNNLINIYLKNINNPIQLGDARRNFPLDFVNEYNNLLLEKSNLNVSKSKRLTLLDSYSYAPNIYLLFVGGILMVNLIYFAAILIYRNFFSSAINKLH